MTLDGKSIVYRPKRADGSGCPMSTSPEAVHLTDESRLKAVTEALRTTYWVWTYYSSVDAPTRLMDVLLRNLPHIDPQSWPERFHFGGIYVNGEASLGDRPLLFPCRVEYYEPKFEIRDAPSIFPRFLEEFIVYHDQDIAVVFKPPKLSSMPAKEQRHFSLKTSIEKLFNVAVHMPSRLDVSAQGLVIVSISSRAHAALQQAFEHRRVTKTYLAASANKCAWEEKIVSTPICRDPLHPVLRKTDGPYPQNAETHFSVLGLSVSNGAAINVLRARPITGRTHQIRVHAASEGLPLVGDAFYGGSPGPHLHLVSCAIQCSHPVTKTHFHVSLPPHLQPEWTRLFATAFESPKRDD